MTQNSINDRSMLRVGTVLNGVYRIESYLSNGGFGNTYRALEETSGEHVALKEFFMKGVSQRDDDGTAVSVSNNESVRQFEEQREKFKKEARRLQQMDNEHIVRVHDLFEENGTAYYVMDYVDGESLAERLKHTGKPLDEDEVQDILLQVLDALRTVHGQNIWHLDIKPANIMVDKQGVVKLIDFGASKQLNPRKGGATTSTAVSYTNGYAPPEQLAQDLSKFGPWTDFYALGATLYNLLSGRRPPMPTDIDDDTTPDKHLALPLPAGVSESMRRLIFNMMNTNRAQRPQTIDDVLNSQQGNSISEDTVYARAQPINPDTESQSTVIQSNRSPKANTSPQSIKRWSQSAKWIIAGGVALALILVLIFSLGDGSTINNTDSANADTLSVRVDTVSTSYGDCIYEGRFDANGKAHGYGKAYFDDGSYYEGKFVHGEIADKNSIVKKGEKHIY